MCSDVKHNSTESRGARGLERVGRVPVPMDRWWSATPTVCCPSDRRPDGACGADALSSQEPDPSTSHPVAAMALLVLRATRAAACSPPSRPQTRAAVAAPSWKSRHSNAAAARAPPPPPPPPARRQRRRLPPACSSSSASHSSHGSYGTDHDSIHLPDSEGTTAAAAASPLVEGLEEAAADAAAEAGALPDAASGDESAEGLLASGEVREMLGFAVPALGMVLAGARAVDRAVVHPGAPLGARAADCLPALGGFAESARLHSAGALSAGWPARPQ